MIGCALLCVLKLIKITSMRLLVNTKICDQTTAICTRDWMSKHRREHSQEYRPIRQYSITHDHAGVRGQSRTCGYKFIVQPWTTCSCEYKINILHDNTWAVHVTCSWRLHNRSRLIGCCCFRPFQMAVWFLVQLYNFQNGMPTSSMPLI